MVASAAMKKKAAPKRVSSIAVEAVDGSCRVRLGSLERFVDGLAQRISKLEIRQNSRRDIPEWEHHLDELLDDHDTPELSPNDNLYLRTKRLLDKYSNTSDTSRREVAQLKNDLDGLSRRIQALGRSDGRTIGARKV